MALSTLSIFAMASADPGGAPADAGTPILIVDDAGMPLAHRVMVGAFTYGGVWQGMDPVLELEAELGQRLDIVHWSTNWRNAAYPAIVDAVAAAGRVPLIRWQPPRDPGPAIGAS